jgi:regulator of extracellular matrix RemA (YlzA/DUF370 family)
LPWIRGRNPKTRLFAIVAPREAPPKRIFAPLSLEGMKGISLYHRQAAATIIAAP